ncbi:hypothetical protein SBV1_440004 [Verrucomicrobia bacterium]|nr:hypothetical protein SBV1_440004 [Verrucomicrobiota bacterium]
MQQALASPDISYTRLKGATDYSLLCKQASAPQERRPTRQEPLPECKNIRARGLTSFPAGAETA